MSDFSLGGTVATTAVQVTPINAAVYTVTISGISGSGTLALNLSNNGSIRDSLLTSLVSGFGGQVYTIDQVAPDVQSIVPANPLGPATNGSSRRLLHGHIQ